AASKLWCAVQKATPARRPTTVTVGIVRVMTDLLLIGFATESRRYSVAFTFHRGGQARYYRVGSADVETISFSRHHAFVRSGFASDEETAMTRIGRIAIAASAAVLGTGAAYAEVTLNSVRVGAANTVALAKFYQSAFGMQEVNRLEAAGGPEIFVNFGAT